jgi:hypothetical protein
MLALVFKGKGVGEKWAFTAASLDGVKALPNHSNDRAAVHVCREKLTGRRCGQRMGRRTVDEVGKERLGRQVGVCGVVSVLRYSGRPQPSGTYSASRGAPCRE